MILIRSERGAVTVFIVVLIVPIYLFQAVLIEFARSKLAHQQMEYAVKAALRSVGGAYNNDLQRYGLFGAADGPETHAIFSHVLERNTGHGWAYAEQVHGELKFERSLADLEVFREQILEEMKYRAPIEYAAQVANKFQKTGISKAMQDLASFAGEAKEMHRLMNRREEGMMKVWRAYHEWDSWISGDLDELAGEIRALEPGHREMMRMDPSALRDQIRQWEAERSLIMQQASLSEGDLMLLAQLDHAIAANQVKLADYEAWLQRLRDIRQRYEAIRSQVIPISAELLSALGDAEKANRQLHHLIDSWEMDLGEEIMQSVDLMADEDFDRIRTRVDVDLRRLDELRSDVVHLRDQLPEPAASRIAQLVNDWRTWLKQIAASESERRRKQAELTAEIEDAQGRLEEQADKVRSSLTGCDPDRRQTERELYQQLQTKTETAAGGYGDRPYGEGRDAQADAVGMAQMIGYLLQQVSESIYVNEYALTTFNYRTYQAEERGEALSIPSSHALYNQEAEYILYGFHSCAANYSAAYWEIFAFRLAVRTLEALMSPDKSWRFLGSPFLALLLAFVEGAVKAYQDTKRIAAGEELPISSKIAPSLTWHYKDYLRLFFLLHGAQPNKLKRMQALIEVNTGVRLAQHYTYWHTAAEGKLRSLFLGRYVYHPQVKAAWGYY